MLEKVDLTKELAKSEFKSRLPYLRNRLYDLQKACWDASIPSVILFEGWDAAGKGSSVNLLTQRLDPRGFKLYAIQAPRTYEKHMPWLWRFWLKLPNYGQMAIFDRSWYGRVMVERIEGFCKEAEWRRAYREINEFERQLVDFGIILAKFWMHISQEEQLRRFEQRQDTPYKSWKLTDEDWRNREQWGRYEEAVGDMLLKTSTLTAPWTIVESNDKWFGRVKTLRTLVESISKELDYQPGVTADANAGGNGKAEKVKRRKDKNKQK